LLYIGKRRLEVALAQFPNKDQVEVEYKSFELNPNAEKYNGKNIRELRAEKFRISVEKAKQTNDGIGKHAASVGLIYNFDEMKPTNTCDAHRLVKFAKTKGKATEIIEKLYFMLILRTQKK
jgi:predicted DsbA family dithiol-disulfide isomerase